MSSNTTISFRPKQLKFPGIIGDTTELPEIRIIRHRGTPIETDPASDKQPKKTNLKQEQDKPSEEISDDKGKTATTDDGTTGAGTKTRSMWTDFGAAFNRNLRGLFRFGRREGSIEDVKTEVESEKHGDEVTENEKPAEEVPEFERSAEGVTENEKVCRGCDGTREACRWGNRGYRC